MATPMHVIRIVGSYSLLTFFDDDVQKEFFEITVDPVFEKEIWFKSPYDATTGWFAIDKKEMQLELDMTNHGLIREAFWRDSFPPIFSFKGNPKNDWNAFIPQAMRKKMEDILKDPNKAEFPIALLFRYSLYKIPGELTQILDGNGEINFHIGLNKFGIVNVGITIEFPHEPNEYFEDLCRRAYKKVAHLQEEPLKNLENDLKEFRNWGSPGNFWSGVVCSTHSLTFDEKIREMEGFLREIKNQQDAPRLAVSYFQVLAITLIHRFLFDRLSVTGDHLKRGLCVQGNCLRGWKLSLWHEHLGEDWAKLPILLDCPWALSNKLPDSSRKGLPPLRHVVFMYQLIRSFPRKQTFLNNNDNKRALLTLGHNVGWSPSYNPPFPLFEEKSDLAFLKDSSLLENSCCFIFPQGLVVVTPPEDILYLGGGPPPPGFKYSSCYSPSSVDYKDYWLLIFKLFIRVVETRLILGMMNRYLSDCHRAFMVRCGRDKLQRILGAVKRVFGTDEIYKDLLRIGWLLQRISENIVTPEVSRFSFVRKKVLSFLDEVHFDEHVEHIEAEFQKLNRWLNEDIITIATVTAIVVAILGVVVAIVSGLFPGDWKDSLLCVVKAFGDCESLVDNGIH